MPKEKQISFLNNWSEVGGPDSGIVRENSTGREGERRIVALDPLYSPSNEQWVYDFRKETHLPFVNAYGSELLKLEKAPKTKDKSKAKQGTDPYKHLAVITERIPHRLVDAPQLTHPEALYVLDRALEGYEVAYQKAGPMRVNDRMIGFNNQGHCKVWVNQDFANNHPSYPRRRLMSTRADSREYLQGRSGHAVSSDQADMVQDVIDTVENYNQQGRFPEPFASQIHRGNLSFADARRLLHNTIVENRIPVPDRVDLFTNRVRGYRKVTNTQTTHNTQQNTNITTSQQQQGWNQNVTTTQTQYIPQTTTVTATQYPVQGYKFNYLPVNEPFKPDIFASRVGDHGFYNGHRY